MFMIVYVSYRLLKPAMCGRSFGVQQTISGCVAGWVGQFARTYSFDYHKLTLFGQMIQMFECNGVH